MATKTPIDIEIGIETATSRGWSYDVTLTGPSGTTGHCITMCWHDHDYWCGGALAPSRMLERLLGLVLQHLGQGSTPQHLPERFDCAIARRWLPDLDDQLRQGSAKGGVILPG
ncbi:MAG: hypothetical protein ACFCBV_10880 [Phycisphaerales bacterium]|nr:hypothetical protein [Phycisphaerales bacterium]